MSRRVFRTLGLKNLSISPRPRPPRPSPSTSRHLSIALPLAADFAPDVSSSEPSPRDRLVALKTQELIDSFSRGGHSHSRSWGYYVDLQNFVGLEKLPLELHQLVLRNCAPAKHELRTINERQFRARYIPDHPHPYERRLQTVIRNIRAAGWRPDIDDYHVILDQFAAVGHYVGCGRILKEISGVGLEPDAKTYGLCLQAMAHRLTLPAAEEQQPRIISAITNMCRALIQEMSEKRVQPTSANMDLTIRILRETADEQTFDRLIKMTYGVDLSFPDRLPLEFTDTDASVAAGEERLFSPHPLSTAALNTIIDMLGRAGRISKMVVAFEVLTQPLPPTQSSPTSFEDEEDEAFYPPPDSSSLPFPLPHAEPNTMSFNLVIKHVAKAGNANLARHYVLHALDYDRAVDRRLRGDVMRLPLDTITSPHFAINRSTLLPAFGDANRDKNVELMRFTLKAIRRILRRKRADIAFYTEWKAKRYDNESGIDNSNQVEEVDESASLEPDSAAMTSDIIDRRPSGASIKSSTSQFSTPSSSTQGPMPRPVDELILGVDLDAPAIPPPPSPKIFKIDRHLSILQRDIRELGELEQQAVNVLGRTLQRVKERLGRRVWSSKDVYFASEKRRTRVLRPTWREIVQFRILETGSVPRFMAQRLSTIRVDRQR